jgi:hypothetical protein
MSPPRGFLAPPLFPDIDPPSGRRLADTSVAAWERVKPRRRAIYDQIMVIARERGRDGVTLSELAVVLGRDKCAFSGRLTELVTAGELQVLRDADGSEITRNGCRVLVAVATG